MHSHPYQKERNFQDLFEEGIGELVLRDKYHEFLDAIAKFHSYSERNIMLIHKQMPEATMVATFDTWKGLGRSIIYGEKSRIKIIVPVASKPKKVRRQKEDGITGEPVIDENGKVVFETVTVQDEPKFSPVAVFDISQTHGEPVMKIAENFAHDINLYDAFAECLKEISDVPIILEELKVKEGQPQQHEQILVDAGMGRSRTLAAMVHEISRMKLRMQYGEDDKAGTEAQAQALAYVVCKKFGLDTDCNPFGYFNWNNDIEKIKADIKNIKINAGLFIALLEEKFISLCKKRGIEPMTTVTGREESDKLTEPQSTVQDEVYLEPQRRYNASFPAAPHMPPL